MLTVYIIGFLIAFGFGFQMEHENNSKSWVFVFVFSMLWFILVPWFIMFTTISRVKGEE